MTATANAEMASAPASIDQLDIFELRAWARARLFFSGELELLPAIDELQKFAVECGLVDRYGQDRIQQLLASAFAEPAA